MENKEFKKLFDIIARNHGFESAFGGWFKESNECIVVLDLQKSNFGNYYYSQQLKKSWADERAFLKMSSPRY